MSKKKRSKAEKTLLVRPGFLFHTAPPDEKLTRNDAIFVDVIHTAGLWLGTDEPVSMNILKILLRKVSTGTKSFYHLLGSIFLLQKLGWLLFASNVFNEG